ncbi:MAG: hypothetical protein ACP5SH_03985 [Syntrophobacteraceae bacterium]
MERNKESPKPKTILDQVAPEHLAAQESLVAFLYLAKRLFRRHVALRFL